MRSIRVFRTPIIVINPRPRDLACDQKYFQTTTASHQRSYGSLLENRSQIPEQQNRRSGTHASVSVSIPTFHPHIDM